MLQLLLYVACGFLCLIQSLVSESLKIGCCDWLEMWPIQQLELCGAVLWYHKALCVSGCCAGAVFWVGTWSLTGRFGVVHQWSSSGPRHQRCIYTSRTADVWESHDGRTTPSWWTVSAWQCRHSAAAETRPERHGDNVCSRHTRPVRHCMSYSLVVVDSPPLDNLWAMIIV